MLTRYAIVLVLLSGQYGRNLPKGDHFPPSIPATDPVPDHPLKVRILTTKRNQNEFGSRGVGSGNLLGETPQGFDYKYNCSLGIQHNEKPGNLDGDFYQGKWNKQDKTIEILTQQPGSTRVDKCELNLTLVAKPYGRDNPPPDPK